MATETINARPGTKKMLQEFCEKYDLRMLNALHMAVVELTRKKYRVVDIEGKAIIVEGKLLIGDNVGPGDISSIDGSVTVGKPDKPYKPWLEREDADDLQELVE